jgi:hypothetical protein
MQALEAMNLTTHEKDRMLVLYEKYVCNLAALRTQRDNVFSQLSQAQQQPAGEWVEILGNAQRQHKAFLSGSAATETLCRWLWKETDLFCDLFSAVVLDVRAVGCFLCMMHVVCHLCIHAEHTMDILWAHSQRVSGGPWAYFGNTLGTSKQEQIPMVWCVP